MRILIATTIFKRHDLTRVVLSYYKKLQDDGMNIELLCCGSEGKLSEDLAKNCGWNYIEHKNEPLARKHTYLFENTIKYEHDAVMLIGSDDLVSREVIEYYKSNYSAQTDFMVGLNTLHFYSVKQKKLIYFKGFEGDNTGRVTMGAGRFFPRHVLEKLNRDVWGPSKLNRGLDTLCTRWLAKNGVREVEIKMIDIPGAMILDIKTDINVTVFERVLVNCNECDIQIAYDKFPEEMKLISELK